MLRSLPHEVMQTVPSCGLGYADRTPPDPKGFVEIWFAPSDV